MRDQINCSCLPLTIYPWDKYNAVDRRIQIRTANEILTQYNKILGALLAAKADPLEIVRLWIRTERLLQEYTSQGFNELLPRQAELRMHIDRAARVLRRCVIRNALLSPEEFAGFYRDALTKLDTHDIECQEDWDAVCDHIDQGQVLLIHLRARDDTEVNLERRLQREQLQRIGLISDCHDK
jgi:hypothetical protein